jgi:predicted nucleotidyltransferase component of viral defense system
MDRFNRTNFKIHEDPIYFREAVISMAQRSGFLSSLIEKDYYCSLILNYLYQDTKTNLVFKGGTCLSKVYVDFYRMSEDLDFAIPAKPEISRKDRSRLIRSIKEQLAEIIETNNCFNIYDKFRGFNESRQYIGTLSYHSVIEPEKKPGTIKIEIGMREELLIDAIWQETSTLLIDPFSERKVISDFKTQCLSLEELFAEKFRAALTRREPAIRDYFDIFYAMLNLNFDSNRFIALVKEKLSIPGNDSISINKLRKKQLQDQIETELKPVLRDKDFELFKFELVYDLVKRIAQKVSNN